MPALWLILAGCAEQPTPLDCEQRDEVTTPVEGDWRIAFEEMNFDDCDMEKWILDDEPGPMEVSVRGNGDLIVGHGQGDETCSLQDGVFTCSRRQSVDNTPAEDYNLNAVILLEISAAGVFQSDTCLAMDLDIDATCSGSDCWLVELATASFPCEMSVHLEAEAAR